MRKAFTWVIERLKHKLSHVHPTKLIDLLKEHGLALVVIIIMWEIVEDVLMPMLFIWLGHNVNPWFITGAPISWLLCLHPIAVPIMWSVWVKISRRENEKRIQD